MAPSARVGSAAASGARPTGTPASGDRSSRRKAWTGRLPTSGRAVCPTSDRPGYRPKKAVRPAHRGACKKTGLCVTGGPACPGQSAVILAAPFPAETCHFPGCRPVGPSQTGRDTKCRQTSCADLALGLFRTANAGENFPAAGTTPHPCRHSGVPRKRRAPARSGAGPDGPQGFSSADRGIRTPACVP